MRNIRHAYLLLPLLIVFGCAVVGQTLTDDSTVRVIVTVTDSSGRPFSGLTQEQFTASENKTPLDITYFDADDKPVSIAFLFDLSSSMPPSSRKIAAQLAAQIIRGSNPANEYAIIAIKETPQIYCEPGCNPADVVMALQKIAEPETREITKTPLYDACDLALKKLATGKTEKRVLIVFSDGQENASKLTFTKLRDELKESNVIFDAFGLLKPSDAQTGLGMEGWGILDELSAVTGGRAYSPNDVKELTQVANVIAMQLRLQYTIGFKRPDQTPDNKWHSIKIKLTLPKSGKYPTPYVRYREGYYSH